MGGIVNDENFLHFFFECEQLATLRETFLLKYINELSVQWPIGQKKLFWFTGTCSHSTLGLRVSVLLAQNIFWNMKTTKIVLTFNTFSFLFEEQLKDIMKLNKKIFSDIYNSSYYISRLAGRRRPIGQPALGHGPADPPPPPPPPDPPDEHEGHGRPDAPERRLNADNREQGGGAPLPPPLPPPAPPPPQQHQRGAPPGPTDKKGRKKWKKNIRSYRARKQQHRRKSGQHGLRCKFLHNLPTMEEEKVELASEEEEGVGDWLGKIIPGTDADMDEASMDTGILDEEDECEDVRTEVKNASRGILKEESLVDNTRGGDESVPTPKMVPPPAPPIPPTQPLFKSKTVADILKLYSPGEPEVNPRDSYTEESVASLAPTSSDKPVDNQLKEIYSLNKIARAKKSQVAILGGGG